MPALTCIVVAVALTLNGCESKPTHDSVMRESIDKMKEMVDIFKGITDEASANAAKPKLKKLGEEMKAIKAKADKLGKPTAEQQTALKAKYEPEMKQLTADMFGHVMRVGMDPKLGPIIKDAMPGDDAAPPMFGNQ
jgi:PHP family Zn ribbon phosphoesterase